MNFDEYQKQAKLTAIYPNVGNNIMYPVLGLIAEYGELLCYYNDVINGGSSPKITLETLQKEIGDVFWNIAACFSEIDENMSTINLRHSLNKCRSTGDDYFFNLMIIMGKLSSCAAKANRDNNGNILPQHLDAFRSALQSFCLCFETIIEDIFQGLFFFDFESKQGFIEKCLTQNINKLKDRQERNALQGDGDNR